MYLKIFSCTFCVTQTSALLNQWNYVNPSQKSCEVEGIWKCRMGSGYSKTYLRHLNTINVISIKVCILKVVPRPSDTYSIFNPVPIWEIHGECLIHKTKKNKRPWKSKTQTRRGQTKFREFQININDVGRWIFSIYACCIVLHTAWLNSCSWPCCLLTYVDYVTWLPNLTNAINI